jgi:hypothetical protein
MTERNIDEIEQENFLNVSDAINDLNQPTSIDEDQPAKRNKMVYVSAMQYYAYLLHDRPFQYIHLFGRLLQQFIVDSYAKIEGGRLNYFRHNQETIRADLYQNLKNIALTNLGYTIGKRIVLPASFKGSPRNLNRLFQDSMAVIKEYGRPDLFITVTCNPQWPEIQNELPEVKNHADKIPIIVRVFKLKLKAILEDIFTNNILGKVKANMYVIEFQKRGLPHAHILIVLEDECKPRNSDDYDRYVSAEIPDPNKHPQAYKTVTTSMVHGPCGKFNMKAPCMDLETSKKHLSIFFFYYNFSILNFKKINAQKISPRNFVKTQ